MRLSGNGAVSRALELAALWLGQWLPTAKVRAAAGLVLKLTWTISRGGLTAHHGDVCCDDAMRACAHKQQQRNWPNSMSIGNIRTSQ
jgi:hypothetical protein